MKLRTSKVATSLVALGFAFGSLPSNASNEAVARAEKELKELVTAQGETSPGYPGQLANLADAYARNGMLEKADETFKKSVEAQKRIEKTASGAIPRIFANYAMTLINTSFETATPLQKRLAMRARAQNVIQEGQTYANRCPAASASRLNFGLTVIQAYRMAGMKNEERAQTAAFDKELKLLESDVNLGRSDNLTVAMMLYRMSQIYAPALPFRRARMMKPAQVVPDNWPKVPETIRQTDFKTAEDYQLRAMALYNRLPESDPTRINAQRNIVEWYHYYGQTKGAELQTQMLSKLLHTTDRDKLFPPAPPCPACGMG